MNDEDDKLYEPWMDDALETFFREEEDTEDMIEEFFTDDEVLTSSSFPDEFYDEPDPDEMRSPEDTESLAEGTVLLDADGYAFQKRRDEWFMAGAQYGATEFSGKLPARRLR